MNFTIVKVLLNSTYFPFFFVKYPSETYRILSLPERSIEGRLVRKGVVIFQPIIKPAPTF
jgi:hypothetical protein